MNTRSAWRHSLLAACLCLAMGSAMAQGIKRNIIARQDASIPGYEAVVAIIEIEPGITAARHSHAGDEILHALEGQTELYIDGRPAQTLQAGQAVVIPAGVAHSAKNTASAVFKGSSVYIVEKGKPLASPAP